MVSIKPKRSESAAPTSGSLDVHELAMDLNSGRLYSKKGNGAVVKFYGDIEDKIAPLNGRLDSYGSYIDNLNNASLSGFYKFNPDTLNKPIDAHGVVVVTMFDLNFGAQVAYMINGDTFRRYIISGIWQPWQRFFATSTEIQNLVDGTYYPYRLGKAAIEIADWNNARQNGWYTATNALNAPTSGWYVGTVVSHYETFVTQTIRQFDNNVEYNDIREYVREYNNGTWTTWRRTAESRFSEGGPPISDWNSANFSGFFSAPASASNSPDSAAPFSGYVIANDTNYLTQFVFDAGSSNARLFKRECRGGTYGPWVRQYTTSEEINALITTKVGDLIDGAPGTLDTLNELAAAIGDDPNFAATVMGALNGRLGESSKFVADINSPLHTGFYQITPSTANAPYANCYAAVINQKYDGNFYIQRAYTSTGVIYRRNGFLLGGGWGAWEREYTTQGEISQFVSEFSTKYYWDLSRNSEEFTTVNMTKAMTVGQYTRFTATAGDPQIKIVPEKYAIAAAVAPVFQIKLRRVSGGDSFDGLFTWTSDGNFVVKSGMASLGLPPLGEWKVLTFDLSQYAEWQGVITDLRFDLSANADSVYDIEYVALGCYGKVRSTDRSDVMFYEPYADGVTHDYDAFALATKCAPWYDNLPYDHAAPEQGGLGLVAPYWQRIRVSKGLYRLFDFTPTNCREIVWEFQQGAELTMGNSAGNFLAYNFLNGRIDRGNRINGGNMGGFRDSASMFDIVAGPRNQFTGGSIAGYGGVTDFQYYAGRERGAATFNLIVDGPIVDRTDTTFSTVGGKTRINFSTPLENNERKRIVAGWFAESPKGGYSGELPGQSWYSGFITDVDPAGYWIQTNNLYRTNDPGYYGVAETPPNGTRILVGLTSKGFATNINTALERPQNLLIYANQSSFPATGNTAARYKDWATNKYYTWSGSAYVECTRANKPMYCEEGVAVEFSAASSIAGTPTPDDVSDGRNDGRGYTWVVDAAYNDRIFRIGQTAYDNLGNVIGSTGSLQLGNCDRGYSARGYLWKGYFASDQVYCGFYSRAYYQGLVAKESTYGYSYLGSGQPIRATTSGGEEFFVALNDGSLLIGKQNTSGTPYFDFRTSGNNHTDSRILAYGGTGTSENGRIRITSKGNLEVNGDLVPVGNNTWRLGSSADRWSEIWQSAGSVTGSDARWKRDIETIGENLGDDVIANLVRTVEAKSFRYRPVEAARASRKTTKTRQVVLKVEREVEEFEIDIIDGKAVQRKVTKTVFVDEPQFEVYPIVDSDGQPVLGRPDKETGERYPLMHKVPVMEEYEDEFVETEAPETDPKRRHFGFIAQDVKAFLDENGISTADFAAFIEDKDGFYNLRYDEMQMLLWPVVRRLLDETADLKVQIEALKNQAE